MGSSTRREGGGGSKIQKKEPKEQKEGGWSPSIESGGEQVFMGGRVREWVQRAGDHPERRMSAIKLWQKAGVLESVSKEEGGERGVIWGRHNLE